MRLRAAIADQGEIATVLDSYLSRLAARDAEGSQKLLSRRIRGDGATQVTESRIAKSHLYENYKSIVLHDVQVKAIRSGDISARVAGTLEYENGTSRRLTSSLDRDGDSWLVNGLAIEESLGEKKAAEE
jgi:hypothetical protein